MPCRRERRTRFFNGFTTIELVVTLIIVGIVAVFVMSRLDFTGAFEQRGVQDKVKAALQFARKAAVAERRYVCVSVANGSDGRIRVTLALDPRSPEGATGFCGATTSPLVLPGPDRGCSDGATNAVCSSTNAAISSATSAFAFDPQGRSTAAAAVAISVSGQPDITVEGTTGYVH